MAEGAFGRAKERQQAPSHPPLKIIEKKRKKYLEKYLPHSHPEYWNNDGCFKFLPLPYVYFLK